MVKGITKTIENKTKEQRGGFLGMFLGILSASVLESMLAGKDLIRAGYGVSRVGDRVIRAGQDF